MVIKTAALKVTFSKPFVGKTERNSKRRYCSGKAKKKKKQESRLESRLEPTQAPPRFFTSFY